MGWPATVEPRRLAPSWRLTLALAFCGIADAGAQVCCPTGCVQSGSGCVTTGANPRACSTVPCTGGGGSQGGGSGGGGDKVIVPSIPLPQVCADMNPSQAQINDAANRCMASLTSNAQLVGCLFEDDAGKAEDRRTGLTCAQRQAALAKQCQARCAQFAASTTRRFCSTEGYLDSQWQAAFREVDGQMVGSARVDKCGPPLKSARRVTRDTAKQGPGAFK